MLLRQMRTDSVGNTARVSITGLAVSEDGEKVYWRGSWLTSLMK